MSTRQKLSFVDVIMRFSNLNKQKLKYEGGDFFAWQAEFKSNVNSLRGRTISRVPMSATLGEKEDCGTHYRQKAVIRATEISNATGYLLIPKKIAQKNSAVIASHGHYKFGKDTVAGHSNAVEELAVDPEAAYGRYAVEAGYVVFVPDWWGWGDKSDHLMRIGQRDRCNVIQMAASTYGFSVLNLHLLEADAAIDFLAGLDFVDEKHIGIIGNSYGGRTAMWIAAFNQKIVCVVSSGAMTLFSERIAKLKSCAIQYFPGLLQFGDVGEVFSLIAPRALQLQAGDKDELVNMADRDEIAEIIKKSYQACDAVSKLGIEYFNDGHILNWPLALKFLKKFL